MAVKVQPPSAGSGGGVKAWTAGEAVKAGDVRVYQSVLYMALSNFTTGATFLPTNWQPLTQTPALAPNPQTVVAYPRTVTTTGSMIGCYANLRAKIKVINPAASGSDLTAGYRAGKDRNQPASYNIAGPTQGQEFVDHFRPDPFWLKATTAPVTVLVEQTLRSDR